MSEFNDLMRMLDVSGVTPVQVNNDNTESLPTPIVFSPEVPTEGSYEILPELPTNYQPFNSYKGTFKNFYDLCLP